MDVTPAIDIWAPLVPSREVMAHAAERFPEPQLGCLPFRIHASANWSATRPSDLGNPRHFDQVACDFPDLKLIRSQAGYPSVLEEIRAVRLRPGIQRKWLHDNAARLLGLPALPDS